MRRIILLLLLCAAVFILSCEVDNGLGPSRIKITGTVVFTNPERRPSNVEEVRVAATAKTLTEIIKGEVGLSDVYFSTAVNFGQDTAAYEIAMPRGTYPLVGVLWKERNKDWDVKKIIGIYNLNCDNTIDPLTVQLTKEQPVASNVKICTFWP